MHSIRNVMVIAAMVLVTGLVAGCAQPTSPQPPPSVWQLDSARSGLSFVSIKVGDLPEAHRFGVLTGGVDASGAATVDIQLDSVDTGIEIRDERMREHVFQLDSYPIATVTAQIDVAEVTTLPPGDQLNRSLPVTLSLSGIEVEVRAQVTVLRMDNAEVVVTAREPILLNVDALGLSDGVEVLRGLAGLPSISKAVPVDFQLTFVGADQG